MNEQQQAELIEALGEMQRCYPQWRFGRLIVDQDVWVVEDEQLLGAAREHLQNPAKHTASPRPVMG